MGAVDFMLRIVTRDIESYERFFFEKLSAVPGIQEVNSIVASAKSVRFLRPWALSLIWANRCV